MADDASKRSIPSWQQAQKPQADPKPTKAEEEVEDGRLEKPATTNTLEHGTPEEVPILPPMEAAPNVASGAFNPNGSTEDSQLTSMRTFLENPAIKSAPFEKKRAFFESKGIAKELISRVLSTEETAISLSDFESFTNQPPQSRPVVQQPQQASAPPIITYPEYLVEAHKPPPLITPGRILNTAYVAGGIAALLYGASKYLVTPMSDSLTESRHEFASHSQSKVDEMNERLAKLVSKVPVSKKESASDFDADETGSETSDPTELYHRDMGTQTSPPPSRRTSISGKGVEAEKKDVVGWETKNLEIMKEHLSEMLQQTEKLEAPNKERQDNLNSLRSYLDELQYTSPGINSWMMNDTTATKKDEKGEEPIDELKKEIRGIKGVLLSAKRFPGVAGRVGA